MKTLSLLKISQLNWWTLVLLPTWNPASCSTPSVGQLNTAHQKCCPAKRTSPYKNHFCVHHTRKCVCKLLCHWCTATVPNHRKLTWDLGHCSEGNYFQRLQYIQSCFQLNPSTGFLILVRCLQALMLMSVLLQRAVQDQAYSCHLQPGIRVCMLCVVTWMCPFSLVSYNTYVNLLTSSYLSLC